jgi:hypothetical protein
MRSFLLSLILSVSAYAQCGVETIYQWQLVQTCDGRLVYMPVQVYWKEVKPLPKISPLPENPKPSLSEQKISPLPVKNIPLPAKELTLTEAIDNLKKEVAGLKKELEKLKEEPDVIPKRKLPDGPTSPLKDR